ncbi:MAG: 4-hydroxy-3-methylbut-2-enyl diphosphate reductase [Oligoflexia bacterium]|nr:4-hydroxy-3-methylbut-2-enyl diphosphate reductase [Oligoflexia bacterium]
MKILIAETAGVCFGVERALNLSEKTIAQVQGAKQSLGPLIHNPQAVEELSERGLKVAHSLNEINEGTVVFRSHGVTIETQKEAQSKGLNIVDATCPLVKVPQNFAKKLSQAGYFVIIVGDAKHPEILGVKSYVENGEVAVIKDEAEVESLPSREKVGVICQTTLKRATLDAVVEKCQLKFKEVKLHNTICSATKDRQEAASELAEKVQAVVVIGGKNSSNTQKLYEICLKKAGSAYLVETESEIDPKWFIGLDSVGITAGASTPHKLIEKVRDHIDLLVNQEKQNQQISL